MRQASKKDSLTRGIVSFTSRIGEVLKGRYPADFPRNESRSRKSVGKALDRIAAAGRDFANEQSSPFAWKKTEDELVFSTA
jgi:hypothetical protein